MQPIEAKGTRFTVPLFEEDDTDTDIDLDTLPTPTLATNPLEITAPAIESSAGFVFTATTLPTNSQGITGPSVLSTLECSKADGESCSPNDKANPKPWYTADEKSSKMSTEELLELIREYPLPEGWYARLPGLQEPANYGIKFETGIYEEQVTSGYRLPLHPFAFRFFEHYRIATGQLVPNGWRKLAGLIYLVQTSGYKPDAIDFMRRSGNSSGNRLYDGDVGLRWLVGTTHGRICNGGSWRRLKEELVRKLVAASARQRMSGGARWQRGWWVPMLPALWEGHHGMRLRSCGDDGSVERRREAHCWRAEGVEIDPGKVKAIVGCSIPTSTAEAHTFHGLVTFYRSDH
ncbi:hypothetical protein RJ640_020206 [Escallonia rubra]|uniref:Transposase (putative) gypsy type domain-containing protein n=1 Tax=Escallonia rubra TaxID=112253 RepID=A0AA88RMI7_9ASTE|nr:hypothetical protein RJ640_020206 [Escallonia rubra]